MDVVSDFFMLCYKLNQNISGEKILQDIQKLVLKQQDNSKEYLLIIKVQEIGFTNDNHIPKIEYRI